MPEYVLPNSFRKRLRKKPPEIQAKIIMTIKALADDPHRPGLRVHQVEGAPGVWTASIDDSNRLTFERHPGGTLRFRVHCNHDQVYRRP